VSTGLLVGGAPALGITYKGLVIDCGYRVDVLVDDRIVVELKASERLLSVSIGLLVNFNVASLRQGLRRFSLPTPPPS
jgi:hypothetical protein